MKIEIHLDDKCIETAAKEKYEDLADELEKEKDSEKEEQLEVLKDFLENANFDELRKIGYDGSQETTIVIKKRDDGFSISKSWASMFSGS